MSDPGAFAVAEAEEQEGREPPPVAGAGVVVCVMGLVRAFGADLGEAATIDGLRTITVAGIAAAG